MNRAPDAPRSLLRRAPAALAGLALMMLGATSMAHAQSDALRPPGSLPVPGGPAVARPAPQPSGGGFNLFGGWGPFQSRPQSSPQPQLVEPPAAPKLPPPEPEGIVYSTADDASQGKKQPPTKFVLVLGDRLAGQLAKGLADGYVTQKDSPAVIGRFEDDSGFLPGAPPDGIDWVARIPAAVAAARPDAVILALGSNDLQPIRDGGQMVEPLTDRWNELFSRRVEDVLAALRGKARNIILVGPAPVQRPDLLTSYEQLNEVLSEAARRAGVTFVNVWDGFVDEDGKFAAFGAAVDGQRRRLRYNDGVRFTRAGARKLAFFTQKDLTRLLAEPTPDAPATGADGGRGPISLTDPPRTGSALAGSASLAPIPASTAPQPVLTDGSPLPAVPGRADDFSWPPRPAATAPSPAEPTRLAPTER